MKIRATYGMTGKVDFSPYEAQTIYEIQTNNWYKTGIGSGIIALGNSNLGWEKTHNFDFGVDMDLLKGFSSDEFLLLS